MAKYLLKLFIISSLLFAGSNCYCAFGPDGQGREEIVLQNEPVKVGNAEFYITSFTDERAHKGPIGKLQPADGKGEPVQVDLKGGTLQCLKSFFDVNFPANTKMRPVAVMLKALNITERPINANRVKGDITFSLTFGLQKDDIFIKLDDYTSSSTYERNAGPAQQIEPLLRTVISNSLIYINNWINVQADNNIKLATNVKLSFDDYSTAAEGDTIYYDANRPLKWTDFLEKPQYSTKHSAEIFASIGYDEEVKLIKGIIYVKLYLKVYAPKSANWVKSEARNGYGLNHEQRHFDIAKIVANHFKQNLAAQKLSVENYDGPINVAYFDALRELDKLQKQYDAETAHSINNYMQQQWNKKIDEELAESGKL
ncbi:hypothetical protein [Mucilaginibacter segetis]|uniref:DUF922 domain-containing protein n=1 Tax=Mucilaginibacter segetis TaxID=2793071 RepID=A0A934PX58_9SPHI|nr:hypothetical protein [Mucilaginibacter segetis]MBK0380780.1 hypothetical protein [Mucilaginibacter segetis]